jgi:CspA family cold shock protein
MYDRDSELPAADTAVAARRVEGRVKWFNATKGYGFITPAEGGQDAFLPMAILRRAGIEEVRTGAAITCEVGSGAKGPLVVNVIAVDSGPAGEEPADRPVRPATLMEGAVKWFEPERGYGFVLPDGGGKDIFIHATALRRSGLSIIEAGQRVRVEVVEGRKGLEADRLTLL